ncbi:MAG: hypothetical protein MUE73_20690 [Planctomycetes bacterium]|jgi:hypothetical protein|nr:hypothetical protein [Planctomycetota bacterium]
MGHPMAPQIVAGFPRLPADIREVEPFYAECLSVLTFLVERFGVEFVREVVARACAGEGPEAALPWLAAHPPPDGSVPPATVPELEAAWLDWVRPGFARLLVK